VIELYIHTFVNAARNVKMLEDAPAHLPCACANLRRVVRMVTQLYDDALRPTGLRAIQFTLLQALNLAPGACAELCACTKNQHTVPSVATSLNRTTASSVVPLSAFSSP
jgi:hypothetical protein